MVDNFDKIQKSFFPLRLSQGSYASLESTGMEKCRKIISCFLAEKFEKIFFLHVDMENENIFPDLISHFRNDCLCVPPLQSLIWVCH